MTKYEHREITKVLLDAIDTMPVVVLSGMRQTGKSTLLLNQPELKNRKYLNFDDFNILEAAKRNPEALLDSEQPITIDEAQKYPEILNLIKREVDKNRKPGRFLLSGSANFLLLKSISESLAGRAVYYTLTPFTRREISAEIHDEPALIKFIKTGKFPILNSKSIEWRDVITGGMPSICLGEVNKPEIWFKGYEQTYLERDIRNLSQVADLISFRQLLQLVALRNGQILKQSELARDAKLNTVTASRYLALMEASFILKRFPPYLGNRSSRLIKSPKIYISDSGLACYLTGVKSLEQNEPLRGAMLENYVAQNLEALLSAHYPEARLAYWNIQGRYEVDFVIEIGKETFAIEVKSASRFHDRDLTGLKAFVDSTPGCRAAILGYQGSEILKLEKKIWAVPLSLLLS